MIAFDTNFVVRLLVEDDARQLAEVHRVLGDAAAAGETCLVPDIVLCEVEWVLASAYGAGRSDLLSAVQRLASSELFTFQDRDRLQRALQLFESGRGDLSDHLLGLAALDHGARTTLTFDRALQGTAAFTVRKGA